MKRAADLPFDPLGDVREVEDHGLFPNLVDELRGVPVQDLIPRGLSPHHVTGIYESGGTAVIRD
ncbi:hypothetical protein [Streptomyces brasiliensis]|uniref:Uncharacterized protein n=1 Tax=Streptomyces brasiliensis TaxID=1954 RepID=A0A917NS48_9ACTN|nr:hypothetical protein [Streptomyces brasiliensis]GGJ22971.1 hypothetical protein GCM10010121_037420 [Streptomyces brasiliensis]